MNDQDLTRVAKQIVTGYSSSDWKGLKSLFTPDGVYNELGTGRQAKGPDQIVETLQGWKQTMTDSRGTVNNAYAAGGTVTLEITWTGTHDGPFPGPTGTISPTGKRQTTQAAMIVKFQGEKIKEVHHYFDMLSFLQQIGALTAERV